MLLFVSLSHFCEFHPDVLVLLCICRVSLCTCLMQHTDRHLLCLVQHLLDTLCRGVETDLRLHIHMHLQLDSRNPFRVASQQLSTFLRMMPIRIFEHDINTRGNTLFLVLDMHSRILVCKAATTTNYNGLTAFFQVILAQLSPERQNHSVF